MTEPKPINWSSLKHLATSPLLYRYRIDHPEPPKAVYAIGSAGHAALLEPEKLDERYAVYDGKRDDRCKAWREWQEENPDVQSLKPGEMARVEAVAEAVKAHPVAAEMLKGCRHEEELEWVDPDTALKCRGRVDAIDSRRIVDLKLARDVDPRRFTRAAADYLYHGQLAMYHTGATVLGKIAPVVVGAPVEGEQYEAPTVPYVGNPPVIIAAQNVEPFDVVVYQMKPEDLAAGRRLVVSLMRKLEECVAANWWPGVAPDLQYLDLPPWAAGLNEESESW